MNHAAIEHAMVLAGEKAVIDSIPAALREPAAKPLNIGDFLPEQGGHFAGKIRIGNDLYGIIVSPKAQGETVGEWSGKYENNPAATSFFDGRANTVAMAEAGSDLAKTILQLDINGHADWHLPSRDELELLYRAFKPTAEGNTCWRGDNPSSVPPGYAYSEELPPVTTVPGFAQGGAEGFDDSWYWSSTQNAGNASCAWCQHFGNGPQGNYGKINELRARAVRRFKL